MHIDEYKLIQKEIDEQNISIIDYAKKIKKISLLLLLLWKNVEINI